MNGVIATDGKRITIAGGHPNFQIWANGFNSGGYRRRAAMDGVEAERIHVIRKTRRAADTGNYDEVFAFDAEVGKDSLDGGEDGVVAAAWAPADFLVGLEVFFCEDGQCRGGHYFISPNSWRTRAAVKARTPVRRFFAPTLTV